MRGQLLIMLMLGAVLTLTGASCPISEVGEGISGAGGVVTTVAPALPGPWGGIAAVVGTLLTVLGGAFASKTKRDHIQTGGNPAELNVLTKIGAERKWLYPTLAALLMGGNALGIWHIDMDKLALLAATLGLPAAGEFVKDALATTRGAAPPSAPAPRP